MIRQRVFGEEPTDPPSSYSVVIDCHHPSFVNQFLPGKLSTLPKLDFPSRERDTCRRSRWSRWWWRTVEVFCRRCWGNSNSNFIHDRDWKSYLSVRPSVRPSVHRPPTAGLQNRDDNGAHDLTVLVESPRKGLIKWRCCNVFLETWTKKKCNNGKKKTIHLENLQQNHDEKRRKTWWLH